MTHETGAEIMVLAREYGAACRRIANFSDKEYDLAWTAVEKSYYRLVKRVNEEVPNSEWMRKWTDEMIADAADQREVTDE